MGKKKTTTAVWMVYLQGVLLGAGCYLAGIRRTPLLPAAAAVGAAGGKGGRAGARGLSGDGSMVPGSFRRQRHTDGPPGALGSAAVGTAERRPVCGAAGPAGDVLLAEDHLEWSRGRPAAVRLCRRASGRISGGTPAPPSKKAEIGRL